MSSSSSDAPRSSSSSPRLAPIPEESSYYGDLTGVSHFLDPNYVDLSQAPEEPCYDRRPLSPVHLANNDEWPPFNSPGNLFQRPLTPITVPREEKKREVVSEVKEIPLNGKERLNHWGFTSYESDPPAFEKKTMRYLCFQQEVCPQTDRKHWQGYVQFFRHLRWRSAQKELGSGQIHMTRLNGSPEENRAYCSKAESSVPGSFKEFGVMLNVSDNGKRKELDDFVKDANAGVTKQKMLKEFKHLNVLARYDKFASMVFSNYTNDQALLSLREETKDLRPWQSAVVKTLDEEKKRSRSVHWVYDSVGNSGKSYLADYLVAHKDAFSLNADSYNNMAYIWTQNVSPICVIDLCRSDRVDEGKKFDDKSLYRFLEQVKNGSMTSGKYESRVVRFPPPKVLVLANYLPDSSAMSQDRWDIINISELVPVQSGEHVSLV